MTVDCVFPINSTEDFVTVGNYALWLIRKTPYLQKATDVDANFILDLGVELFGSDILSHPRISSDFLSENLTALLQILSNEIGITLDHIQPEDLIKGVRSALGHILELITAFIAHCVEQSLLDFDESESTERSQYSTSKQQNKLSKTSTAVNSHLSNSPELPRSVGRPHPPIQPVSQLTSYCRTDVMLDSDAPLPQSINDSAAQVGKLPSGMESTQFNISCRNPSIASLLCPNSPPTTPKAMDEFLEIINPPSPDRPAPSLKSSPINTTSFHCEKNLDPLTHPLDRPAPEGRTTTLHADFSATGSCPSSENSSIGYLDKVGIASGCNYKASSSTSGRGHSPTHTLTALPSLPNSSCPSSLSSGSTSPEFAESNPPEASNGLKNDADFDKRSESSSVGRHSTSTDSILAWGGGESVRDSFLFSSDLSASHPSTAVLIERTDAFTKNLKRRLDYLKTVSNRAREEAQAVNLLVHTVGTQNANLLQLMQTTMQHGQTSGPTMNELCQMLKHVLDGVNLLVERQSRIDRSDQPSVSSYSSNRSHRQRRTHTCSKASKHHEVLPTIPSDMEFTQLMNLKHQYMQEGLRLCREDVGKRLNVCSRRNCSRCPNCNAVF